MGGIFSSPSSPPLPMPEPPTTDDQAVREQSRLEALERRRRGRAGTILTSERGLVHLNAKSTGQKDLLGE